VNLQALLDWLVQLPHPTLLAAMVALAALENIFPPMPADVLIAFGAFVAARQQASPLPAFLAVLGGNMAGAILMYALGRHFGAAWTEAKFHLRHKDTADSRLSSWYARYGVASLFLARFIPGVRAIVAPFAGALKTPVVPAMVAICFASVVWYGLITILAFRAGNDWEAVAGAVGRLARNTGLMAVAVALAIVAVVWFRRRHRSP
jgi:membrane protein DedA with SNARE-associated domain